MDSVASNKADNTKTFAGEEFLNQQNDELISTAGSNTMNADEFDKDPSQRVPPKSVKKASKKKTAEKPKEEVLSSVTTEQKTMSEAEAYKILLERLQKNPESIAQKLQ